MDLPVLILGLIVLCAAIVVIFSKDKSILITGSIVAILSLGVWASFVFNLPLLILFVLLAGFVIAWCAREELIIGRRWFIFVFVLSLLSAMIFAKDKIIVYSSIAISLIAVVSWYKSKNRKKQSKI